MSKWDYVRIKRTIEEDKKGTEAMRFDLLSFVLGIILGVLVCLV